MVVLDIKRDDVNNSILKYFQDNPLILSTHFYNFILWIQENYIDIVSFIKNFVDDSTIDKKMMPRLQRYHRQFNIVTKLLFKFVMDLNLVDYARMQSIDRSLIKNVSDVLFQNSEIVAASNTKITQRALKYHFVNRRNDFVQLGTNFNGVPQCVIDNDFLYIQSEKLTEIVNTYIHSFAQEERKLSSREILKELKELNAIKSMDNGSDGNGGKRSGYKSSLPKTSIKRKLFYRIFLSILEED